MSFKEYTIEECCDILDNLRTPLNSEERFDIKGEYPYYGANGVQGYISKYAFDDDLILVAEDGGNFEQFATRPIAYRVSGKCWINNHAHVLKAKKNFSQPFIFYSLEHKNILYFIVGGTRSKLTQGELRKITIKHPDKIEADKIGKILSNVDELILKTKGLIDKYRCIKTGLMQDLLTKGIDAKGKIRSKTTHKFVKKSGIEVPEDWTVSPTIEELYMKGRIGWQGLKASEFQKEGNYLVTGIHFTKDNKVDWNSCYRINDFRYNEAPEIQLRVNDVLLTKDGTIGKVAFIDSLPGKASLNSHLLVLRPLKSNLYPRFLFYSFLDSRFKFFIESIKSGSTLVGLSQTNFGKYNLLIPPPKEQAKIITILNEIYTTIEREINYLDKLYAIKNGLMQDLLSGRVRVK